MRERLEDAIRRTPLLDRLAESSRRITRMCAERRCPRMSIPPEPGDDDIFICQTIEDAIAEIKRLSEDAMSAERQRLDEIERRARRYVIDDELSRALAAHDLTDAAAELLKSLWRSQFVVYLHSDSFAVRTPDLQTVGEFVSQQLARPEYADYFRGGKERP